MKNSKKKWLIHLEENIDGGMLFYFKGVSKIAILFFILFGVIVFVLKEVYFQ